MEKKGYEYLQDVHDLRVKQCSEVFSIIFYSKVFTLNQACTADSQLLYHRIFKRTPLFYARNKNATNQALPAYQPPPARNYLFRITPPLLFG
jgi:hypothetical protein